MRTGMKARPKRIPIAILSALIVFAVGLWAGTQLPEDGGRQRHVPCRPSLPALAAAGSPVPTVLFWGNSIAFDHDWRSTGRIMPVNCAVQGMTASTARALTEALPEIEVSAVVLVLGSVELARGSTDQAEFDASLKVMLSKIRVKYRDAAIIVLGIPFGSGDWTYDRAQLEIFQGALRNLPDTTFFDTATVISQNPMLDASYDGVHLRRETYLLIEKALADQIDGLARGVN